MRSASDQAIWDYALRENAAIVTKDEDFAQRKALGDGGPVVIWVRLPNARSKIMIGWFGGMLPAILLAVARGETLVEVL
jgi:predicted nuclease of predicted toxin-antitoxin system